MTFSSTSILNEKTGTLAASPRQSWDIADARKRQPIEEKRRAPRYKIAIPGLLEIKSGDVERVTVSDISLAGFACDAGQFYAVGTRCWLKLPVLPQMPHFSMMEASVVRCSGDVVGCAFSYMLHPQELDPYIAEYQVLDNQ